MFVIILCVCVICIVICYTISQYQPYSPRLDKTKYSIYTFEQNPEEFIYDNNILIELPKDGYSVSDVYNRIKKLRMLVSNNCMLSVEIKVESASVLASWKTTGALVSRKCLLVDGLQSCIDCVYMSAEDINSFFGKMCVAFINDSNDTKLGIVGSKSPVMKDDIKRILL